MNVSPEPLERAREAMAALGIDAVLAASPGMVAFLTGHVMPPHLAYPSRDGRLEQPTLALVNATDAATIGADPAPMDGLAIRWQNEPYEAFAAVVSAAEALSFSEGSLAVELTHVPAGALCALTDRFPGVRVQPLGAKLHAAKAAKSNAEAAGIRAACALADAGHQALREVLQPGATELELYSSTVRAMNTKAGGLVLSGCELQVGSRTELVAGAPTDARVALGDLVMCDLYPRHPNGWWADSCSTIVCGEPDAEHRQVWQQLYDGLQAGREALRPGARAADVFDAVCAYAGDQPFHAGHGIGRDHWEEPIISRGNQAVIPFGAVIVLEPGRYGNGRGMRLEWAFRVTEHGGEPMTSFSLAL